MPTATFPKLDQLVARFPFLSKFLQGGPSCAGLDVGSTSVKGVLLKKRSQGWELLQWSVTAVPAQAQREEQAARLRKTLAALGAPKGALFTAVGGQGAVLRSASFPKMTHEELKTSLHFEAEKYIPFKLEEIFLDFSILGDEPGGRMEVILAAAKKDLVEGLLALLNLGGAKPSGITLEAVALANAWEIQPSAAPTAGSPPSKESEGAQVLLQVGARGTILNFFVGKALKFTREIPTGGGAFTQAVAEGLQLEASQAEQLKCAPGDRLEQVKGALAPSWEEWLTQCRTSFDFFENQFGKQITRLFLSGGSAKMVGFKEWVQTSSGLPTELWNPMAGLSVSPAVASAQEAGIALGVAIGCALSGASG